MMFPDGKKALFGSLFLGVLAFSITYTFSGPAPAMGTAQLTPSDSAEPFLDQIRAEPDASDSFNPNGGLTTGNSLTTTTQTRRGARVLRSQSQSHAQAQIQSGPVAQAQPQTQFDPNTSRKPLPALNSISLNSATVEDLIQLPDVGRVLAQRIIDYRTRLNGYTSLDELKEVKGIGTKRFEIISPYLKL